MVKELIRNGGFERGNYDFWSTHTYAFEIQTAVKKYGTYASKVTLGATGIAVLNTKDYISVSPFALYKLTLWMKNNHNIVHAICAATYDSDYQVLEGPGIIILGTVGVFDWTKLVGYFVIDDEASYISIADGMLGLVNQVCYHDAFSLLQISPDEVISHQIEMVSVSNLTTKDTYYADEYFTGIWKQAEYHLYCTSLTGTAPTLDVTIQGYDPNTEQWKDVLVFQQLTTDGSEFKTVLSGLGWKQRVKYVLGGTTVTDCDFKVGVVYKR